MEQLRNCPCCGEKAEVATDRETFDRLVAENGSACVRIACTDGHNCGVNMYCHFDSTNYDVMVAVATDRWNRRTANE